MTRRPRRSAKRPTPRPARRPSAGAPANGGLPALSRRLEQEGPQARSARQGRVRDAVAAAAAEIRQRVDDGHELWQAVTGEPMPLELEEIRAAAVRFGLSPDAVLAGNFTLADVTTLMVGKRQAAADEWNDRVRAAGAEAAVRRAAGTVTPGTVPPAGTQAEAADDEYADIARRLSDNARSVIRFLHDYTAYDRSSRYPQADIASELGLSPSQLRVVFRRLAKQSPVLFESKEGRGGGTWLTPAGKSVAERIPPQTCRQFKPVITANSHQTRTG
jgi:hypothetical protein